MTKSTDRMTNSEGKGVSTAPISIIPNRDRYNVYQREYQRKRYWFKKANATISDEMLDQRMTEYFIRMGYETGLYAQR